jgi:beta-lactamase superfamily II metal-dependent hydrolase
MKRGKDDGGASTSGGRGSSSSGSRSRTSSTSDLSSKDAKVAKYFEEQFPGLPKYFAKLKPATQENLRATYKDEYETLADAERLYPDLILAKDNYLSYFKYAQKSIELGATKYTVGGLADDTLTVAFLSVGSGDCIVIKTPAGHVFVVDCGSRKRPEGPYRKRIQDVFKTCFLKSDTPGAKHNLKAMILTHPDRDHYNEIVPVLAPIINKIEDLFYSLDLRSYNDKAAKDDEEEPTPPSSSSSTSSSSSSSSSTSSTSTGVATGGGDPPAKTFQFLAGHAVRKHRVTINSDTPSLETDSAAANKTPPYAPDKATKSITVHKENWHGSTCEIILLAAGVTKKSQSDLTFTAAESRKDKTGTRDRYAKPLKASGRTPAPTNTASIVTLVKARDKKLLLCGDATYLTELYLLQNHLAEITKVDVAQIEHHGAGTAHGAGIYVEKLDPFFAAVSTGTHGGDNNPRWRVIQKYLGYKKLREREKPPQDKRVVRLKNDQAKHVVETFDPDGKRLDVSLWEPHESSGIFSTRTNGDILFTLGSTGEWKKVT